jgi:hypothetical protein
MRRYEGLRLGCRDDRILTRHVLRQLGRRVAVRRRGSAGRCGPRLCRACHDSSAGSIAPMPGLVRFGGRLLEFRFPHGRAEVVRIDAEHRERIARSLYTSR